MSKELWLRCRGCLRDPTRLTTSFLGIVKRNSVTACSQLRYFRDHSYKIYDDVGCVLG